MLCESTWASEDPLVIEVFTDSTFKHINSVNNTTVYRMDRIDRFQQALSQQLPGDPEIAKKTVIQRLEGMDADLSNDLEYAAKSLLQALQYGINRYPAIVFDGQAVVYGVTDIKAATLLYQQWQVKGSQQ